MLFLVLLLLGEPIPVEEDVHGGVPELDSGVILPFPPPQPPPPRRLESDCEDGGGWDRVKDGKSAGSLILLVFVAFSFPPLFVVASSRVWIVNRIDALDGL